VTTRWQERPEGGGFFALWLIRTFAIGAGRTLARLVLYPITLYFFLRRGPERRASRGYLARVLGRPARAPDVIRHIPGFAPTIPDRVFLLGGEFGRFDIRTRGLEELHRVVDEGRGLLLVGSHLGSFDAMRALSLKRPDIRVRIVIDTGHNPAMTQLFAQLNPALAAGIIDARMDGTSVALAIKEALDRGEIVTLLADRPGAGEPTVAAMVLGAEARLPSAPWLLASALKVPVALCFGLYLGGNRYDLEFEAFSDRIVLERRGRDAALAGIVQRYADRLSHHARAAPWNWFNFYDYWQPAPVREPRAPRLDAPGVGGEA
jgi:predicted LPLAT superfamily acyltransferase